MTAIADRWHMLGLRALYAPTKENAPTEGGQSVQDNRHGNDSAGQTPEQRANQIAAEQAAQMVRKLMDRGDTDSARMHWCEFARLVVNRDADHVAKLERMRGLRP